MNHARDWRLGSGPHIGRRARNRARGGQPAKKRRHDVRHALRHQLHIGIVFVVAHAIGNHRRHQGFDRAKHGHCERGRKELPDRVVVQLRHSDGRQSAWNSAEARPDGFDRKAKQRNGGGRAERNKNRSWNSLGVL